jgi:hypothetical protein
VYNLHFAISSYGKGGNNYNDSVALIQSGISALFTIAIPGNLGLNCCFKEDRKSLMFGLAAVKI